MSGLRRSAQVELLELVGSLRTDMLLPYLGQRIGGGCDDRDAWTVPKLLPSGVVDLTVSHDDECPWLAEWERRQP